MTRSRKYLKLQLSRKDESSDTFRGNDNEMPEMSEAEWTEVRAAIQEIRYSDEQQHAVNNRIMEAQLQAAKRANWIAGFGAAIAALGLGGVMFSILIATKASKDGAEAAKATTAQAKAAQIANRPWIPLM